MFRAAFARRKFRPLKSKDFDLKSEEFDLKSEDFDLKSEDFDQSSSFKDQEQGSCSWHPSRIMLRDASAMLGDAMGGGRWGTMFHGYCIFKSSEAVQVRQ